MNVSSCVNCPVDVNPFEDSNATSKGGREGKQASKQVPVCIVVAYRVPKYFVFLFSLLASLLTFGIKLSFVFKQKKKTATRSDSSNTFPFLLATLENKATTFSTTSSHVLIVSFVVRVADYNKNKKVQKKTTTLLSRRLKKKRRRRRAKPPHSL